MPRPSTCSPPCTNLTEIRPDPEAFIEALDPLQPRVYSISSSHRRNPGRVTLTVDVVRYEIDKRMRLGVCSTFLGGRVTPGDKIRVYVQKAQHFALPDDPTVPIIMIGPGTGVAPFRAFLQERRAIKAPGRNWLFFGHQRSDYDYDRKDKIMSRIFISGSSTGLGLMAGELLASQRHRVVLHARNAERADDARRALPGAEAVVVGDLETIGGAKEIASQVNALGRFDAVIHNAAVGYSEGHRVTSDGPSKASRRVSRALLDSAGRLGLFRKKAAARLQGLAEPNSVVIAEGIRKLVATYLSLRTLGHRATRPVLRCPSPSTSDAVSSSSRPTSSVRPLAWRASKRLSTDAGRSAAQALTVPEIPLRSSLVNRVSANRG
jgi:NAD(P)-dependent dehydrogenase (short-subunit alcohol dehydrogenase family)